MPRVTRGPGAVILGGYQAGLAVVDGLAAGGVPAVVVIHSPNEFARSSRRIERWTALPHPEREPAAYLERLEALATGGERPLLVPTTDETLGLVARHRDRLGRRYAISCMDAARVETVLDKERTYEVAAAAGIPVPRTFSPSSEAELDAARAALGFPLLVKPRESHRYYARFGRKMVKAHDDAQLRDAWREAREADVGVLVQEFIQGPDAHGANYNSYADAGAPIAEFTAAKRRIYPREIGFPAIVVSARLAPVAELGRRLLSAFAISGFSCTEFKLDARDGRWKLMEVNARHNLSGRLAIRCGVNFPLIDHAVATGGPLPRRDATRDGVYWVNLTPDLVKSLPRPGAWREYARALTRPHVFDVLDRRDPRPFFTRVRSRGSDGAGEYLEGA